MKFKHILIKLPESEYKFLKDKKNKKQSWKELLLLGAEANESRMPEPPDPADNII